MTLYCLIKDGQIVGGPRALPPLWYGWPLPTMADAELRNIGWLPTNAVSGVRCSAPQIYADRIEYAVDLDGLRRVQRYFVNRSYAAEEVKDFVSSALGTPHTYGVRDLSQRVDLLGSGLIGRDIDYSCIRLSDGAKASYPHSAAQMQQVLSEAAAWREGLILRLNQRLEQIDSAGSADEIKAVVW